MASIRTELVKDRDAWDAIVQSFDGVDVRQSYDWGELRRRDGWTPARFVAIQQGRSIAAVSVLHRRLPALPVNVMYVPRGPVVLAGGAREGIVALLHELNALARVQKVAFLRMSPPLSQDEPDIPALLQSCGARRLPDDFSTWNSPRIVMTLDLHGGETAVRGRMRKSTRQSLDTAIRKGVKITDAGQRDDFLDLHRLVHLNAHRKGLPVRGADYFQGLYPFTEAGIGFLSFAELNSERIAAQFSVRYGHTLHILYYGVDPQFLPVGTARALDWHHLKLALSLGCRDVDFGGSGTHYPARTEDFGYGVYQYKAGLGCQLRCLARYHDVVYSRALYRMFRLLERRVLPMAWSLRARF
jgi:lipid II:glycine glycyltransferase (peptidoglycan interpeptide bridge formation enzyme)